MGHELSTHAIQYKATLLQWRHGLINATEQELDLALVPCPKCGVEKTDVIIDQVNGHILHY